jgi:1-acyl-sn-glycerol-3-phosphate acyltransferase
MSPPSPPSSLVPQATVGAGDEREGLLSRFVPEPVRDMLSEIDERTARIPTRLNRYGFDPFGLEPTQLRGQMLVVGAIYRHYLRVETRGIERVPEGRVLLVGNHAGNTFAWDGAMLGMALFLEGDPPRMARGMAEYYLPKIPFFNVFMHRIGSVVGTPGNCAQLLRQEEAIMVFPEGQRGFVKTYRQRYRLQRFGLGFLRLALETDTPIVPVGIVGGEEHSPGLANVRPLGRLVGAPAFPITIGFPWLGLAGFLPLPVKFRLHFGAPLHFQGDPADDDATIEKHVAVVKGSIRDLIAEAREARRGWFG